MKRNSKKWTAEYESVLANIQALNNELTAQHSFINQQRENLDVVSKAQQNQPIQSIEDVISKAGTGISLNDYHKLNTEYIKQASTVLNMRISLSKIHGDIVKAKNATIPTKDGDDKENNSESPDTITSLHEVMKKYNNETN